MMTGPAIAAAPAITNVVLIRGLRKEGSKGIPGKSGGGVVEYWECCVWEWLVLGSWFLVLGSEFEVSVGDCL